MDWMERAWAETAGGVKCSGPLEYVRGADKAGAHVRDSTLYKYKQSENSTEFRINGHFRRIEAQSWLYIARTLLCKYLWCRTGEMYSVKILSFKYKDKNSTEISIKDF